MIIHLHKNIYIFHELQQLHSQHVRMSVSFKRGASQSYFGKQGKSARNNKGVILWYIKINSQPHNTAISEL